MREFVGVIDPFIVWVEDSISSVPLKRHALIFDRLAIPGLDDSVLAHSKSEINRQAVEEVRLLADKGIVFEPSLEGIKYISSPDFDNESEAAIRHTLDMVGMMFGVDINLLRDAKRGKVEISKEELASIRRTLKKVKGEKILKDIDKMAESPEFIEHLSGMMRHQIRVFSIKLREIDELDAYPILSTIVPSLQDAPASKDDVVKIVVNALPMPDDSTSWQQIVEYRDDPDSKSKFTALRVWMSEMARSKLTKVEVEEKLEHLLNEYQKHLQLHRIKTHRGKLQAVVLATGEFLEDLASKKFSKIAQELFSATQQRINLLEGELTAPGREVAYIVKAQDTF